MTSSVTDPHFYPRVHEYKSNPPALVELRTIPDHHFTAKLTGNGEKIDFLPRVSALFDQAKVQVENIFIRNTLIADFSDFSGNLEQITQCFDISSRPVGQALQTSITLRLKLEEGLFEKLAEWNKTVVLMTFDNNSRCWQEIKPVKLHGYFEVSVQFFGKFCFFAKPIIQQFMLSEVATSHNISSSEKSGKTSIKIENDKFDQYGAVLSVNSKTVTESDLKRVTESIGVRNIKVDKVFELEISGNKKAKNSDDLMEVSFESCRQAENENDKQVVLVLVKSGSGGVWKCEGSGNVKVGMGKSKVMFLETDAGNAQDSQKMEFFGSELDFILDSSETTIFVHQHKTETNRVHLGFFEKSNETWELLGKNENIVLKENSEINYSIGNGHVLKEDKSPKNLKFFKYNRTGLDVYLVSESNSDISVKVGVKDSVTKEVGTVLDCKLKFEGGESEASLKPYIQEKMYDHVTPPEIYREYKLEYLKYLSPSEREQYKHINGM